MASSLLLSLYLVATLAVFAAASSRSRQLSEQQQPSSYTGSGGGSCDGTNGAALLEARGKCCNDLGEHGHCICSQATTRKVFDTVNSLRLCKNYDACSARGWNAGGDDAATTGGCSLDHLDSMEEQCGKVVKILEDLALVEKSSGNGDCFKEALVKLGIENTRGVVELLLRPAGN